jgi:hypothetical protein
MGCVETREYMMPRHTEDRTFTIEVTVHARAHIESGGYYSAGGYTDEPPWTEIDEIEIDYIEIFGHKIVGLTGKTKSALIEAAYEEFE